MRGPVQVLGVGVVLALIGSLAALPARGQDGPYEVLILAPSAEREAVEELHSAVQAHLSDLGLEVEFEEIEDLPDDLAAQLARARSVVDRSRAIAVVWISRARDQIHIVVSDEGTPRLLSRELPGQQEGWREACENMAAVVRSTLEPFVEEYVKPAPAEVDTPPPEPDEPEPHAPEDDRPAETSTALRSGIRAGYSPLLMNLDGPLLHGAHLGLGLDFLGFLGVGAGVDLLQPAPVDAPGVDIHVRRVPVRLSARAFAAIADFEIGGRVGVVADITDVGGDDAGQLAGDAGRVNWALAPAAAVRYLPWPWLGIWVELGADLYFRRYDYLREDQVVLEFSVAQLRGAIGLEYLYSFD